MKNEECKITQESDTKQSRGWFSQPRLCFTAQSVAGMRVRSKRKESLKAG